jgi:hypothetical protein
MGYELHIHRAADDWMNASSTPISEAEWLGLAEADPALVRDGGYGTKRPDRSTAELASFSYAPPGRNEGCGFSLDPEDGSITVAGAYDATSRIKAVEISKQLGARVQGDDGEFYGDDGEGIEADRPDPAKRGLFGRLRGR